MNEAELLDRCRAGDSTAFAALVEPYRNRTWAVCLQITSNAHDAEDALQDALTLAWQNMHRFRGDSLFSTWLHRIAANAALAIVRRRKETVSGDHPDLLELADNAPLTEDRVVSMDAVRTAIAQLPEEFREAIVLREFADMSYADIATHQGIPIQTVKSRLNRARSQIAASLLAA